MPSMCTTFATFHWEMSATNDFAPRNVIVASFTPPTSQRSNPLPVNAVAPRNIPLMSTTPRMSHAPKSPSNPLAPLNIPAVDVTCAVFQLETSGL
eukprot:31416-Pelagococcus_subviridis.AAC.20